MIEVMAVFKNVHISGVGTYHPQKVLDNEYYINHFKQSGEEEHVKALLEKVGRNTRTLAEEHETSISMEVNAAQNALNNAGLTSADIDMIISATDTPEFLSPSCALLIKNKLQAKNVVGVFDVNSDCIGMLIGIDVASRYLKTDSKKYKRILVTGSFLISPFARKDNLVTYAALADGAAAIILEVKEQDRPRGFLGSNMFTDDSYNDTIRFPSCGLSNINKEHVGSYERKMEWNDFDFSFLSDRWYTLMAELLEEHDYTAKDVSHYCMSQFSKSDIEKTLEKFGANMEKATFVGDKYGYTGSASPIMALAERLQQQPFHEDDLIVFCSVAAGYSMSSILYKW